MASINQSIHQMMALEELAHKDTQIHRLAPVVKLLITILYIIMVISYQPTQLDGLLLYASFPVFFLIVAEIPFRSLAVRCLFALPFALFAGISNLILSRDILLQIGAIGITEGMITFTSLLVKTVLTVMAVLLLVSTTPMNDLTHALAGLHVPPILIVQFMMTYRYLSLLGEEASRMSHAYLLRAPREKGIRLKDVGPFMGQLILRSFDRADRIYHAMQCRGFDGKLSLSKKRKLKTVDWVVMIAVSLMIVVLRFIQWR